MRHDRGLWYHGLNLRMSEFADERMGGFAYMRINERPTATDERRTDH